MLSKCEKNMPLSVLKLKRKSEKECRKLLVWKLNEEKKKTKKPFCKQFEIFIFWGGFKGFVNRLVDVVNDIVALRHIQGCFYFISTAPSTEIKCLEDPGELFWFSRAYVSKFLGWNFCFITAIMFIYPKLITVFQKTWNLMIWSVWWLWLGNYSQKNYEGTEWSFVDL